MVVDTPVWATAGQIRTTAAGVAVKGVTLTWLIAGTYEVIVQLQVQG